MHLFFGVLFNFTMISDFIGSSSENHFVWFILAIATIFGGVAAFENIIKHFKNAIESIKARLYAPETKRFVDIRNIFVEHLDSEVKRLNREADWNDFHYTKLEAEVEIDPSLDFDIHNTKNPIYWLRSFYHMVTSTGLSTTLKVQKNLIHAIKKSSSRVFLVIGDPGSGKTVSLRHLFIEMAKTCVSSRNKDAVVPIYLNLKHLNVEPDKVDANIIHDWIIEQLRADQDRTIDEFLDKNFERMLDNGNFFFIFDSFDEIPGVMDGQEEQETVRQYAIALDRFLHSQHKCRGLVSSRQYRAPKVFIGQKMKIRPLSAKRIKKALYKYMGEERKLAKELWQDLVQSRKDMLDIAENPFYLGLLSRYSKDNQRLPERHYDLFEHFVTNRTRTDENRLRHFGLTPVELIEWSSMLAFGMTMTPHIGLEADVDQLREITKVANCFNEASDWNQNKLVPLLHALSFSKLGRLSREEPGKPREFSFVHRRFHEYLCARYLKQNPRIAPFEKLAADDRWREVLVLLCEVLTGNHLIRVFDTAGLTVTKGINADSGSIAHRKAIETILFLRDGFRNRIDDIPSNVRALCSKFIQRQLEMGTLLDKKRAIEGVSIADDKSVHSILECALTSDSAWLRENALKSCRILRTVPDQIGIAIRSHLYHRYTEFKIHRDYSSYSVLFSSPPSLRPFKSLSTILMVAALIQILLYSGVVLYGIMFNIEILLIFMIVLFFVLTSIICILPNFSCSIHDLRIIKIPNPWILLPIGMVYTSFILGMIKSTPYSSLFLLNLNQHIWEFIVLIFFNVFLLSLVSYYPNSFGAWLLHIIRVLTNILTEIRELVCGLVIGKKLLKIIFSVGIFFGIMGLGVGVIVFLMNKVINWAEKVIILVQIQDYSIANIYSAYGFNLGSAVVLTLLLIGLTVIILVSFLALIASKISHHFMNVLHDQIKLKKLSYLSNSRPSTTLEAIQILHSLKSQVGEAQYVQALFKWLPAEADSHVLIEESNKHHGAVRDKLCQLAEIWEDSIRGKG